MPKPRFPRRCRCQPLLGSWLLGLRWGHKKCPPCTIRGGRFGSEASGALVLVKPTQVALAAAHQRRPRRSVGKCARSAPWILASVAARFRKRPVLSHGALAGAVASFCAAFREHKKSRRRSCFIADGPFYYFGRFERHGASERMATCPDMAYKTPQKRAGVHRRL